ncbi:MAG: HD domain-containing protein [Clostridiaceae bacterium]
MNNIALELAYRAHMNQKRKGSEIPYIIHPLEVAVILIANKADEDTINAGILHDTIEDTTVDIDEIREKLGDKVAELVLAASEPYKINAKVKLSDCEEIESWKERKIHTINYVKTASRQVQLLTLSDKLSNLRSLIVDYQRIGNKLWKKFNAPCSEQKWYYESLVNSFISLNDIDMYKEFKEKVKILFESKEVFDYINDENA